ncbi:MAG: MFS transporter [Candidatus Diapherotrites archaeon]|uniref:MFS transporter n=1 Tax=Candidatus Iainarchaeum sp. TaxID=3101447 RepID=A0A938YT50_9ARCH|nr:MFS transporter [Candidatus Diapherotrites archaeon]
MHKPPTAKIRPNLVAEKPSFGKINLIVFMMGALGNIILVFVPLFLAEMGLTGLEIGILIGTGLITRLFASIPIGVISDRFSTKAAFYAAIAFIIIFLVGLNFTTNFFFLLVLFILLGLGKETINSFLDIFTLKAQGEKAGKTFGKFQLSRYLGSGTGALLSGIAIAFLAFALTFNIVAVLVLLLLVPIYLLKDVPKEKINLFQYGKDFLKVKNVLFAGMLFLFTFHWGAEHTTYGLFLKNYLDLDTAWSGLYISITLIFLALAAFLGGRLIDKGIEHKKLFIVGVLFSGIGHIMMVNENVFVSLFWRILHEAGDGLFFITQFVWISLLFEKERIGGNYGIMFTIMTLGAFTGAIAFGPLGEATNYTAPFIVSGAILIAEALILGIYIFGKGLKKKPA